jgi:hypothetical protein
LINLTSKTKRKPAAAQSGLSVMQRFICNKTQGSPGGSEPPCGNQSVIKACENDLPMGLLTGVL